MKSARGWLFGFARATNKPHVSALALSLLQRVVTASSSGLPPSSIHCRLVTDTSYMQDRANGCAWICTGESSQFTVVSTLLQRLEVTNFFLLAHSSSFLLYTPR